MSIPPALEVDLHKLGGADFISQTTVNGTLFGIAFALYCLCARSLYVQSKDVARRGRSLGMLAFISLVTAMGMIGLALDARVLQMSYVDHGDYPGGGFMYHANIEYVQPITFVSAIVEFLCQFLTASIQIWRIWVIWNASNYVFFIVSVPVLLFLSWIASQITLLVFSMPRQVPISNQVVGSVAVASYSLDLSTTLTTTALIILRIAVVRKRLIKTMDDYEVAGQYTSMMAMLIESFAIDSVWSLGIIISWALSINVSVKNMDSLASALIFAANAPYIRIVAYFLVVYRVTIGRGWRREPLDVLL